MGSAQRLGEDLNELFEGKRVVFIASVDFSHYLTMEEADKRIYGTCVSIKVCKDNIRLRIISVSFNAFSNDSWISIDQQNLFA